MALNARFEHVHGRAWVGTRVQYELDVCFRELFFKVLQSRSATFEQKLLLVETLTRIASKPQVVMDIYLNFDCDPDLLDSNVFERCVH